MTTEERFKQLKTLLGDLDDLNQQRRRVYTDWAMQKIDPGAFAAAMLDNLKSTRQAAETMETLIRAS
jgi:hypothetical protein